MAQFYGCEFVFDGIPSRNYDLRILDFQASGVDKTDAGSEASIFQKQIFRRSRPYYYGRSVNKNLEFDITVGSGDPISSIQRGNIDAWLLGRMNYCALQIVQHDMTSMIFNVIFTKASNAYVGNVNRGMTYHAYCSDPWGFEEPKELVRTYSGSAIVNEVINFYNDSDDADYLRPQISFTMGGIGDNFTLKNVSDDDRIFYFTNLQSGETITVDNSREIISSSTGLLRMNDFNKRFFRLIPQMNQLVLTGGITEFVLTYQPVRKIGG